MKNTPIGTKTVRMEGFHLVQKLYSFLDIPSRRRFSASSFSFKRALDTGRVINGNPSGPSSVSISTHCGVSTMSGDFPRSRKTPDLVSGFSPPRDRPLGPSQTFYDQPVEPARTTPQIEEVLPCGTEGPVT